jgi:glycosyltransferase involved in cell wall biosynthesis
LSIGRLVPEKGFDTLLKAFKHVTTAKQLVVVGGGSHSESYVTHLHSLADPERVKFPGYIYGRMLEELFSNAFLFVSASEVEGLPFAILEAMSFGTPVLATDIPPHEEILGGLGYLFPRGDVQALARALQDLLDHPERVRGIGRLLRERAITTYSWGPVAKSLEQVYDEVLALRTPGGCCSGGGSPSQDAV